MIHAAALMLCIAANVCMIMRSKHDKISVLMKPESIFFLPTVIHILPVHISRLVLYRGGIVNKIGTRRAPTWSPERRRSFLSPDTFNCHNRLTSPPEYTALTYINTNGFTYICGGDDILQPSSPKHFY